MPNTSDSFAAPHALVIGEALVDVVLSSDGTRNAHPGGSPMNVAVGLARLGLPTVLATMIGTDTAGAQIIDHLEHAGVTLSSGSITDTPTSSAVATLDPSGAAHYDFNLHWDIPTPHTTGATLIHTGSIGSLLEPGATAVRRTFAGAQPSTLLSFDPNIRPDIMGAREDVVPKVEALASTAHVVKMSDEDAEWLYPGRSHTEIADKYSEIGVALFVITRGAQGCYMRTDHHKLELAPPSVTVVDTIGAGDAFMSGLLYTLLAINLIPQVLEHTLDRQALEHAACTALASAAITVSRARANPPNRNEMDEAIRDWFKTLP
ncbi:UNVERIFIED_CONTAM: carbohydrate kinase [Kocuria sp. CPCC 205274]